MLVPIAVALIVKNGLTPTAVLLLLSNLAVALVGALLVWWVAHWIQARRTRR